MLPYLVTRPQPRRPRSKHHGRKQHRENRGIGGKLFDPRSSPESVKAVLDIIRESIRVKSGWNPNMAVKRLYRIMKGDLWGQEEKLRGLSVRIISIRPYNNRFVIMFMLDSVHVRVRISAGELKAGGWE